jgi:antiviral helicase SKI2
MMALGKKKIDASTQLGTGVANEEKALDEAIGNLLQAEQMELHDLNLPLLETQSYVKRGSDVVRYRQACEHASELVTLMRSFASHVHPNLELCYKDIERRETLREKVETLQHLLSNESLQLFPDFLQRKGVLRKLGYVDDNETVCVKGRVACEVNTCEELIVTEMVFEGVLNDMEPEEIVAVLSSLVYQEKKDEELSAELPPRLVHCCEEMKKIATNLGQLQKEQGLDVDPGEYCDKSLKFGLVHVVYEWALGVPFKNICELTDVQEGSIVRCITRLDELCREVRNCARVVGNPTLYRKLEAASTSIKRDIVFASSLYVS